MKYVRLNFDVFAKFFAENILRSFSFFAISGTLDSKFFSKCLTSFFAFGLLERIKGIITERSESS